MKMKWELNKRISTKQSRNIEILFCQYQIYWCVFYLCTNNCMCCWCYCYVCLFFLYNIYIFSYRFKFGSAWILFWSRLLSRTTFILIIFFFFFCDGIFPFCVKSLFPIFYQLYHRIHFSGDLCKCCDVNVKFWTHIIFFLARHHT